MDNKELKEKISSLNQCQIWDVIENCMDILVHSNNDLMAAAYENLANETLTSNYVSGTALKIVAERIREHNFQSTIKWIICNDGFVLETDIDVNGKPFIRRIYDMLFNEVNISDITESQQPSCSMSLETLNKVNNHQHDITALKKRIKHCKNPLEKKSLEKALNKAYKRRKIK